MRRLPALALALCAPAAHAGLVFTPHLSEYARLAPGEYTEFMAVYSPISKVYEQDGSKVDLGTPFVAGGDRIDATLLLIKYIWAGNLFRDTAVPVLNTHPQFCRLIGNIGQQQATGRVTDQSRAFGMHSTANGLGDLYGLCGVFGDDHRWGPLKANGLLSTTVKFPIGRYDRGSLLNMGTNYWSVIPQFAYHGELYGRLFMDGTFAWQFNGDSHDPAYGGLAPSQPADWRNAEGNFAWKFDESFFADVGFSWHNSVGGNRYGKVTINFRDQPQPPTTACATLHLSDPVCNSANDFFLSPRPGPYRDGGVEAGLLTAGFYYIYRTSTVVDFRVAQPLFGRGGQIDLTYDVAAGGPPGHGGIPVSTLTTRVNGVQEAAATSASPLYELRLVYLFWAP